MKTFRSYLALLCACTLLALVCVNGPRHVSAQTFNEGFESGTKTAYATADVQLATGWWNFNDALIGNLSTDRKNGTASARIRNVGIIQMDFDVTSAGTVTIQHAIFSSDGSSSWELWASTNGGSTYTKVGNTVNTTSTTLTPATFTVNSATAIRFSIRKVSGGTNRINIDDVTITPYVAPPPAGEHLTMGNPSNAVVDVNQPSNYLLDKPQ